MSNTNEFVRLTDEQIDACVYKQCPDFDQWHEGPSIDDCRAIARATAAPLLERIKELERQVGTLDSTVTEVIKEREHAQGMADDLAKAIGEKFRVDPGEHSNMNCPWTTALAIIDGEYITDSDQDRRIAELEQQLEAARKDAERYRWLRDKAAYVGVNPHAKTCLWVLRGIYEVKGKGFTESVDAAISKEQAK